MIVNSLTQMWDKTANARSNRVWKVKVKLIGDGKWK